MKSKPISRILKKYPETVEAGAIAVLYSGMSGYLLLNPLKG
jgi:hypothetical protein